MFSSEIDLRKNPQLRLLQFNLHLDGRHIRKSKDDVVRWFDLVCRSVISKSLVVEVRGFTEEAEICNKIQDTLLALYKRIGAFSVYLYKEQGNFPKLYETGIVVEEDLRQDENKQVGYCILTLSLLRS